MKRRSKRLAEFLEKHPVCCYCGGHVAAETIDHLPPMVLFRKKQRPKGFEFPACDQCNSATASHEQQVAYFAQISHVESSRKDKGWRKLQRAIQNNFPGLLEGMVPTKTERRRIIRDAGLWHSDLPSSKYGLVVTDDPRIFMAQKVFGIKLACALHYQHTRKILPIDAGISMQWRTNFELLTNDIPEEILRMADRLGTLRQGRISVEDQFMYRYAVSDDGMLSMFIVELHQFTKIVLLVAASPMSFEDWDDGTLLHPFSWA